MEYHYAIHGKNNYKLPFSIAILVITRHYTMVYPYYIPVLSHDHSYETILNHTKPQYHPTQSPYIPYESPCVPHLNCFEASGQATSTLEERLKSLSSEDEGNEGNEGNEGGSRPRQVRKEICLGLCSVVFAVSLCMYNYVYMYGNVTVIVIVIVMQLSCKCNVSVMYVC